MDTAIRRRSSSSVKGRRSYVCWFGSPAIPLSGVFAAIDGVPLMHLVREIRIGKSVHRVCLHDFLCANFRGITRCNRCAGNIDAVHRTDLLIRGASHKKREEDNGREEFHGSLGLLEGANVESPTVALLKSIVSVT